MDKIKVEASIAANRKKVWEYYTSPKHIVNWNFASEDWCCPSAENDLRVGGSYRARMEAKDGSFGFDFSAVYREVRAEQAFSYDMDGREVNLSFEDKGDDTFLQIEFDGDGQNSVELQRNGWQAILNNFKKYVEAEI